MQTWWTSSDPQSSFLLYCSLVSELVPNPASALTGEPVSSHQPSSETRRHLLAGLLSALAPGTGQVFLGQRRKGIFLLLVFGAILLCFWPLRFLRFYAGFIALYFAWIILYLYAPVSALLARLSSTSTRPSKWWLLLIVPVSLLAMELLGVAMTRGSGFRSFSVPSTSMEKTIRMGGDIVVDTRYYRSHSPARQDLIVFTKDNLYIVKRVVAIGGDSVKGIDGIILVNGASVDEPYVQHTGQQPAPTEQPPPWMNNFGPTSVPDGTLFVLGDNRDVSLDSRYEKYGSVTVGSVVGRPLYVFASDHLGKTVK